MSKFLYGIQDFIAIELRAYSAPAAGWFSIDAYHVTCAEPMRKGRTVTLLGHLQLQFDNGAHGQFLVGGERDSHSETLVDSDKCSETERSPTW